MSKSIKIGVNIFILLIVAGFIAYMVKSVNKDDAIYVSQNQEKPFVSDYEKVFAIDVKDTINAFATNANLLYVMTNQRVKKFDVDGHLVNDFSIKTGARDIMVSESEIYVLYPTFIDVYSLKGDALYSWEACSDLSDYCAFTLAAGFVFVTDAGNKNICKYTKEGNFVAFINSPRDFITPSHAYDITSRNDTIYCVNPGRHLVESYTLNGDFISAFGGVGGEEGFFAGCCNPAFIIFTSQGNILTSEKGNPRISSYDKDGTFKEVILNSRLLGGGHMAYEVKEIDNQLFIASIDQLSIYRKKN